MRPALSGALLGLLVLLRRARRESGTSDTGSVVVGALFALAALCVTVGALVTKSQSSLVGLGVLALGLPAYAMFRARAGGPPPAR